MELLALVAALVLELDGMPKLGGAGCPLIGWLDSSGPPDEELGSPGVEPALEGGGSRAGNRPPRRGSAAALPVPTADGPTTPF